MVPKKLSSLNQKMANIFWTNEYSKIIIILVTKLFLDFNAIQLFFIYVQIKINLGEIPMIFSISSVSMFTVTDLFFLI